MTAVRRWGIVLLGSVLVVLVPLVLPVLPVLMGARPGAARSEDPASLVARIRGSGDVAFSGYAQALGALALPDNRQLSSLAGLLGGASSIRVWWSADDRWRVANLRTTGETDLYHAEGRTLRWVYESKRVTVYPDPPVRLPTAADLLPNVLARWLLQGARPTELQALPPRRVAGRDALGVRLTPASAKASIGRVEVYADAATGLPVQVTLWARGASTPALRSAYSSVSYGQPPASALRFTVPGDASVREDDVVDLASAADKYGDLPAPPTLLGLPRRADTTSVGVYGRGPTVLMAVPIWDRYAADLRAQLAQRPGVQRVRPGLLLTSGPLTLLLAADRDGHAWLLAGTVTRPAALQAAGELGGGQVQGSRGTR